MRMRKFQRIIVAAVFVMALGDGALMAQQQINADGHALDANNQIGSGGSNNGLPQQQQQQGPINTQVPNNVSGTQNNTGAGRGVLTNTRENENTRENYNAINNSVGATGGGGGGGGQSFYSPPNALVPGSLPPAAMPQMSSMSLNGYIPASGEGPIDLRLPSLLNENLTSSPLPKPGELNLPGPVDPTAANTYYTNGGAYQLGAARLGLGNQTTDIYNPAATANNLGNNYDLGTVNPQQLPPQSGQIVGSAPPVGQGPVGPVERARFDIQRAYQIRQELNQNAAKAANNPNGAAPPNGPLPPPGSSSQSNQPMKSDQTLGSQQVIPTNLASAPGDLSTGQSMRNYLAPVDLPPAASQSKQFAALRKKLEDFNNSHPLTDEEANRQFLSALQAYRKAMAAPPVVGAVPPAEPPAPAASPANRGSDVAPLQVQDLATGISSKALYDLIREGETLVQSQQYSKAIGVYDEAIHAAPNNPLLYIGRAEAELGGSFYRQAEYDLRQAFHQDKAVMMGQYDIAEQLGRQRLQYVENDLKQIATDSPQNATSVFLLAYICYNTHREVKAAAYLDLVSKRSSNDDVVPLLKQYWTFQPAAPSTQPAGDK